MEALDIDNINKKSPYKVLFREDRPCNFYFITDYKVEYSISIGMDCSIIPSGAYVLDITNAKHKNSPNDIKFRQTLVAIIEEFFEKNNDVMLYIAETGDEAVFAKPFVCALVQYIRAQRQICHSYSRGRIRRADEFSCFLLAQGQPSPCTMSQGI